LRNAEGCEGALQPSKHPAAPLQAVRIERGNDDTRQCYRALSHRRL